MKNMVERFRVSAASMCIECLMALSIGIDDFRQTSFSVAEMFSVFTKDARPNKSQNKLPLNRWPQSTDIHFLPGDGVSLAIALSLSQQAE